MFEAFIDISEHQLLDYRVISLHIFDIKQNDVFRYDNSLEAINVYKDRKSKPKSFPLGDQEEFSFIKLNDKIYFKIISPIYEDRKLFGYIDIKVEVGSRIVRQFRRALIVAVVHTAGTIAMMALALYPLILTSYRKLQRNSRDLLKSHLYTIKALGNAIAERDSDTDKHNYRVTYFSLCMAERLNLSAQSTRSLVKGAFLHDVGKIGISDSILLKPSSLTAQEYAVMKTHVELGVQIVNNIPWLEDSIDVIRFHHERYDGSGYPLGIAESQIPVVARIFSVVDVFDSLISNRPYKHAFSYSESIKIIKQSIKQFDPWVFSNFMLIAESLYKHATSMAMEDYETFLEEKLPNYFKI